jgi:uncharacterized glyoxalase superfamily protein PhnB
VSIYPVIRYHDARAAIDFLDRAFGFKPVQVHEQEGAVVHAELAYGDGMVMIGTADDTATKAWSYVVVADADAHYEQAKAGGAEIVREIEDQDYGSRDYSASDPEGNVWSFGTYRPSAAGQTI